MSIIRKVRAVEKVFAALDQEIKKLQGDSGLHCISGCGKCCFKADIEATPLEFIPFAFHLFLTKQIDEFYQNLKTQKTSNCALFAPVYNSLEKGTCSQYVHRGLICRLFGFSANRNKNGMVQFVTCKPLKDNQPDAVAIIENKVKESSPIPMMSNYYFRIRSIDPDLGTHLIPINQAILKAMEVVMGYYAYRTPPVFPRRRSA